MCLHQRMSHKRQHRQDYHLSENWKLQVSYKTPSGDLINVRGDSAEELSVNLESIGDYATQIASVGKLIAGAHVASPLSTPSFTQEQAPTPPSNTSWAPPASATSGPTCQHGQRVHKSGVAKASGKPYSMWVCPLPQGHDQCKPVN